LITLRRIFVAMLLVGGLASYGWTAQDEVERVHKVVPLQPGGSLKLDTFSGHVVITATDDHEVVIDAVRRAPRARLNDVKLNVESSGSTVRIQANKRDSFWSIFGNNVVETDFDIKVPRRTNIDVSGFSCSVSVAGVTGSQRVHTFSGLIRLAEVDGPVNAHTFSGNIDVQLSNTVRSPELDLHTFSGDVTMRVADAAAARVEFSSFSGDLRTDVPLTLSSRRGHVLRGDLGSDSRGSNSVRVKTFSGDVHLQK
jgi:DUF4097 and DUF4098 domain-containing protein YvlB